MVGSRAPLSDGNGGPQAALGPQQTPPPMPQAKGMAWDYFFMIDDNMPASSLEPEPEPNEARDEKSMEKNVKSAGFSEVESKTPEKLVAEVEVAKEEERTQIEHSKTAPADFRRVMGKGELPSVNLMQLLSEIDDQFLKASECAQEVLKMLEAARLHYHSNFADNRGSFFSNLVLACF